MSPKLKKVLRSAGYPIFYLAVFSIFLVVTFPYDRLKERVVVEFNARQPAGAGTRLSIEDMSGYWLSGVEAEGIKLTPAPEPPGEDGKIKEPKVLTIDEAHARASILRLLVGTLQVSFGAQAFGGEISGSTSVAGGGRSIEIELDGVNVGDVPFLTNAVGLPLTGSLSGMIDLRLPEAKLSRSEGKIDLKVTELSVGDGKAKIRDTIALPKLDAGEMVFTAEVNDGRLKIEKFSAKGKDIEVVADGSVRLRDPFDQSLAELSLRFSFTDAYKNKSDITRGLFGEPGSSMPGLFDLDPKTKRAKRPDGFYAWRMTGPLGKLEPQPAPMGTGGGAVPSRSMRGFAPR